VSSLDLSRPLGAVCRRHHDLLGLPLSLDALADGVLERPLADLGDVRSAEACSESGERVPEL